MVTLLDALRAWTILFGIHVANATRGVEMEILVLLWYLLAAVGVALAASERGRGFLTWTVAALFLSPLFAVLLLIAFPPTARARAGAFVGLLAAARIRKKMAEDAMRPPRWDK